MDNTILLRHYFKSFMKGDVNSMLDCYHEKVIFEDQVFGRLEGEEVIKMWRMLLHYGKKDLQISYKDIEADDVSGSAKWRAVYFFGKNRRQVINHIESSFKFQDNKIIEHRDYFDMWKWSKQAMGWKGCLLGWSIYFKTKIQQTSREKLKRYDPEYIKEN